MILVLDTYEKLTNFTMWLIFLSLSQWKSKITLDRVTNLAFRENFLLSDLPCILGKFPSLSVEIPTRNIPPITIHRSFKLGSLRNRKSNRGVDGTINRTIAVFKL